MDDEPAWTWSLDDPRLTRPGQPAEQTPDFNVEQLEAELREFLAEQHG
jgi:hypothetical protein